MSARSSSPRRARRAWIAVAAATTCLLAACGQTPSTSGPTATQRPVSSVSSVTRSTMHATDPISRRIAHLSLRDRVRQLVVVGFGGTRAPTRMIHTLHPGGLIYFSSNLRTSRQIRVMSQRAQRASRRSGQPLLIMTDQEGGPVTRLPGTTNVPGGAEFHGHARWARRTAVRTAHDLMAVGINLDLAPVADVNTVGHRGVIGSRSFSSHPAVAARLVRAQVCGYHQGGVAATVKHFPGHGSTTTDSHRRPAKIRESRHRWHVTDLPPFLRAVRSGVDVVLLGHLAFPAMDPSGLPATISPRLDRRLLRQQVGFDGVVMTDALNMGGITAYGSSGSIAVRAIRSGVDLLLMPPHPVSAVHALVSAVRHGRVSEGRLNVSVRRILELKKRLGLFRSSARLHPCR
ncbi:MAG: glycoside hydrolase family 3 protein [Nocardioidaceae bacterium]